MSVAIMRNQNSELTWKDVVQKALSDIGKPATLVEIYQQIKGHWKCETNPTWRDTVRRTLQQYSTFKHVERGIWGLKSEKEILKFDKAKLKHSEVEGLLLELGKLYGHETFTPDRSSRFRNDKLGGFASLNELPKFTYDNILKDVKQIDVLWFLGDTNNLFPTHAFEVEHTTKISRGLLRLYQLYQTRRSDTNLYIVAPEIELSKFDTEINKYPYKPIKDAFIFKTYKSLLELHNLAVKHDILKVEFLQT